MRQELLLRPEPPISDRSLLTPEYVRRSLEANRQMVRAYSDSDIARAREPRLTYGYESVFDAAVAATPVLFETLKQQTPEGIDPLDPFYMSAIVTATTENGSYILVDSLTDHERGITETPFYRDELAFNGMLTSLLVNGQTAIDHYHQDRNAKYSRKHCVALAASSLSKYLDRKLLTVHGGNGTVLLRYLHSDSSPETAGLMQFIREYNNELPFLQFRVVEKDGHTMVTAEIDNILMMRPYNVTYRLKEDDDETDVQVNIPRPRLPIPPVTLTGPIYALPHPQTGQPVRMSFQVGSKELRPDLEQDEIAFAYLQGLEGDGRVEQNRNVSVLFGEVIASEHERQRTLELHPTQQAALFQKLVAGEAHAMKNDVLKVKTPVDMLLLMAKTSPQTTLADVMDILQILGRGSESIAHRSFTHLNHIETGRVWFPRLEEFNIGELVRDHLADIMKRQGATVRAQDFEHINNRVASLQIAALTWLEFVIENAVNYNGGIDPHTTLTGWEDHSGAEPLFRMRCSNYGITNGTNFHTITSNVLMLRDRKMIRGVDSSRKEAGGTGIGLRQMREVHDYMYIKPSDLDTDVESPYCRFDVEAVDLDNPPEDMAHTAQMAKERGQILFRYDSTVGYRMASI